MSTVPKTMKAWLVTGVGSPRAALEFKRDWPVPSAPKNSDIMVRVSHAALNPLDLDLMGIWIPFRRPALAAVDFVGRVVQIGPSTSNDIQIDMTVCGTVPTSQILRGNGTLAEYVVIPEHAAAAKPHNLDDAVSVGLMGVAGQTTSVLLSVANANKGDRILVNGASGGVGSLLVQVLSAKGIHVTGICSKKNEAFVSKLGAEETFDYTAPGHLYDRIASCTKGNPFDMIMDCVGDQSLYRNSPKYLKDTGKFMCIAGKMASLKFKMQPVFLGGTPRTYLPVNNNPAGFRAKEAASWCELGWVKGVPIDEIFDLDHALEGYEKLATKHAKGKIIVKIS